MRVQAVRRVAPRLVSTTVLRLRFEFIFAEHIGILRADVQTTNKQQMWVR
jgi:hypothetical protein